MASPSTASASTGAWVRRDTRASGGGSSQSRLADMTMRDTANMPTAWEGARVRQEGMINDVPVHRAVVGLVALDKQGETAPAAMKGKGSGRRSWGWAGAAAQRQRVLMQLDPRAAATLLG